MIKSLGRMLPVALGILWLACEFAPPYEENLYACDPLGNSSDCPPTMVCVEKSRGVGLCCFDESCSGGATTGGRSGSGGSINRGGTGGVILRFLTV